MKLEYGKLNPKWDYVMRTVDGFARSCCCVWRSPPAFDTFTIQLQLSIVCKPQIQFSVGRLNWIHCWTANKNICSSEGKNCVGRWLQNRSWHVGTYNLGSNLFFIIKEKACRAVGAPARQLLSLLLSMWARSSICIVPKLEKTNGTFILFLFGAVFFVHTGASTRKIF